MAPFVEAPQLGPLERARKAAAALTRTAAPIVEAASSARWSARVGQVKLGPWSRRPSRRLLRKSPEQSTWLLERDVVV